MYLLKMVPTFLQLIFFAPYYPWAFFYIIKMENLVFPKAWYVTCATVDAWNDFLVLHEHILNIFNGYIFLFVTEKY